MAEAEGIPPTASVASTGFGINYVGNWAYAYSPSLTITTATQTILEFISQAGILVSRFHFLGPLQFSDPAGGRISTYQVSLNDDIVAVVKCDNSGSEHYQEKIQLILPPFTKVKVIVDSNDSDANFVGSVIVTGRVYDA